ncbi:ABC transporter ATP-binding protein [Acetivibrio mesophilus]|uniref:ABC transporter ATP-binding protein n=1 Tax=Acetivibrio mesophilus TaxID=2487273 RepID=A0A4Q0I4S0_9FIRM|nr:ABC transporter ATP-binding protein [Acetivibrio mesophilus]RXE59278.1 ABC transporter ATP-binding protein [Acetivibrio mesophilus]
MRTKIKIENLSKTFKAKKKSLEVLKNLNIELYENQFVSLIGPSGCGKSTILRILAGLEKDFSGDITVNGESIKASSFQFGYMPQKDLLMPWRTVYKNIILPLEINGTQDRKLEVENLIKEFGLQGFENFYPGEISGGMKQRAGILRTFLMDSDIMLLDEPFGALDAITRIKMQEWLLKVLIEHKKTVLFITHDIEEAVFLSDRVYVLSDRPAHVIKTLDIGFPRPRNREMLSSREFLEYKDILLKALL